MIRALSLSPLVLALIPAAAAQPVQLTAGSGVGERHPVVALDGELVAYVGMVSGVREVFVVDPRGGTPRQVTTGAAVQVGWSAFDAWPALSITDNADHKVAYWNKQGTWVLDVVSGRSIRVAAASLLPYPQIDGDGQRVVFQDIVGGDMEVFVVPADGSAPPRQITQTSGAGRRLPHVRGDLVVFQKPVGIQQEVYLHDLGTQQTRALGAPTGSGRSNRYARLLPDASAVVFGVQMSGRSTKDLVATDLMGSPISVFTTQQTRGDRTGWPTEDGEAVLQMPIGGNQEVILAGAGQQNLTPGVLGGLRRPSTDRHGTVIVWQAPVGDANEVFAFRRCGMAEISTYGVHGTPSVGVLRDFAQLYRCDATVGLSTGFRSGTPAALMFGTTRANVPLPGGNFLYLVPVVSVPLAVDAAGELAATFNPPVLRQGATTFLQWAVLDPPNALGAVTSKGVELHVR